MRLRYVVAVAPLALGGCALPLPLQLASFAADGVSFAATGKSVSDHGLSAVAGQDCALWRGVTEGEICVDGHEQAAYLPVGRAVPVTR